MAENPIPPDDGPDADAWALERLLDPFAEQTPDGEALSDLLQALQAPGSDRELAGEPAALTAFSAAFTATPVDRLAAARPAARYRRSGRRTAVPPLAIAGAAVLVTLGATAAAAYQGILPAPIQNVAHRAIGAPASTVEGSVDADPAASRSVPAASPSTPPTALLALCNAYTQGRLTTASADFPSLQKAARGAASVSAFCATVIVDSHVPAGPSGAPRATPTPPGATQRPTPSGPPVVTPVTPPTPGTGGATPAVVPPSARPTATPSATPSRPVSSPAGIIPSPTPHFPLPTT